MAGLFSRITSPQAYVFPRSRRRLIIPFSRGKRNSCSVDESTLIPDSPVSTAWAYTPLSATLYLAIRESAVDPEMNFPVNVASWRDIVEWQFGRVMRGAFGWDSKVRRSDFSSRVVHNFLVASLPANKTSSTQAKFYLARFRSSFPHFLLSWTTFVRPKFRNCPIQYNFHDVHADDIYNQASIVRRLSVFSSMSRSRLGQICRSAPFRLKPLCWISSI